MNPNKTRPEINRLEYNSQIVDLNWTRVPNSNPRMTLIHFNPLKSEFNPTYYSPDPIVTRHVIDLTWTRPKPNKMYNPQKSFISHFTFHTDKLLMKARTHEEP